METDRDKIKQMEKDFSNFYYFKNRDKNENKIILEKTKKEKREYILEVKL